MPRYRKWVGERFGRLVVLESLTGREARVVCDCGNTKTVKKNNLTSGNTKSCGCFLDEERIRRKYKHGMTYTRTYEIWWGVVKRCKSKTANTWERYGGRGITICSEWLEFENFLRDMGECPEGLSIDRIDNNLGYCKENCRWATLKQQARNKRTTLFAEYLGERRPLIEVAETLGLPYAMLRYHVKLMGRSVSEAQRRMESDSYA